MNKIEIIKSLYEELTDEEKSKVYDELLNNNVSEKTIDFYSDEFIDFITHANNLSKLLYMHESGEIEQINYIDFEHKEHIFNTYDEAYRYWEEHFDNVMKRKYSEDSNEYQCFNILSYFDFEEVEEKCKILHYTYYKSSIDKEQLIKDAIEILQSLCSKDNITTRQIGRLIAIKVNYPKEDGGNYFSLMFCMEHQDNSW